MVTDTLPTFAQLRHRDVPISFKPGHVKNAATNPKWASYSTSKTTKQYYELGGRSADWSYDLKHGIVTFDDPDLHRLAQQRRVYSTLTKRRSGSSFSAYLFGDSDEASSFALMATKASFMDMLGGRTLANMSDELDVYAMSVWYDKMRTHKPLSYSFVAQDIDDTILDSLYLHCVDNECTDIKVYLSVSDAHGFTIDEKMLTCLKGYDRDGRQRMVRAIHKEIRDLIAAGTFELAELPSSRKAIGSKFVLKVKYKADGTYDKDKARMVAQGFCERIGKDFYSTFSPMASLTSVRALFAIAVYHRLGCYHADIPNAFVRSKTETELYLRLPKGVSVFLEHDPTVSTENGWVLRMLKSLYGLKDAGALFNKELDRFFVEEGYTRGVSETSMYYKHGPSGWVVVLTEVDDLVVTGTDDTEIDALRSALVRDFANRDSEGVVDAKSIHWETISSFMGIDINYNRSKGVLTMNVKSKIDDLFNNKQDSAPFGSTLLFAPALAQVKTDPNEARLLS